jgi:hypothetical protein
VEFSTRKNNLWGENEKFLATGQLTGAASGVYLGFLDANLFNWYPLSFTAEAFYRLDHATLPLVQKNGRRLAGPC